MVSPLNKKLFRDLWHIKGQAAAISIVIALGVMMVVMMTGLVETLEQTRNAYYERYRLADIFAPAVRAPNLILNQIGDIEGVQAVEGRVTGSALIDLDGVDLPLRAIAISLPDYDVPRLNNVYLNDGRLINARQPDEILLLDSFAKARGLKPGDTLTTTMNGGRRDFKIVGLAQSPEYLYTTAPGEFVPDDGRFAVIWMSQSALSAIYDMKGAFNEALVGLTRGANEAEVLDAIDRLLDNYGGQGAYGLEDQFSNRFVTEEISGLKASAVGVPPVFLAVAAFLLNIVITRLVQAEREQIGLLKAFGYFDWEVAFHYFKLVLVIAVSGAVLGSLLGIASGSAMAKYYQVYYKFPFIVFQLSPASLVTGFAVSVIAASAGGMFVLRRVFALTPAVAMRPPAPADFSRASNFGPFLRRVLDQPSRMVLRRVMRQPGRIFGAMIGIAAGMALSVSMIAVMEAFDDALDVSFSVIDRSDATVTFVTPVSTKALIELEQIKGVEVVEPVRAVSVVFHNGVVSHRGGITALTADPSLNRALDDKNQPINLPSQGVVLSVGLADKLGVKPGDVLSVEVREGRRPVLDIPVSGIAETLMGSPAYMRIDALDRALNEPGRVSGAYLLIDAAETAHIADTLKAMPIVAAVSLKKNSREAFEKLMDEGAGATRYVMAVIAFIITFGIVYNTTRIAYAESARDLASLRVIGFTKGEAAFVLLGEIGIVTLLAMPVGAAIGYYLSYVISEGFSTDLYQVPVAYSPTAIGAGAIAVILAALGSGWLVKRDVDRLELVSALKTRE
ncbi:MAG: ABC transporter permease [Hyphomicrobiaceae bacterium]|nr:ABC transporter permease [Hyphomicrobiaceae bacterium]